MVVLSGNIVFGGIAFGKIGFFKRGVSNVKRQSIEDIALEINRFENAKKVAKEQLKELYEKANTEVGEANALIFEIHQMMLDDGDYCDSIINIISMQKVNAEYAVATSGDHFAKMFSEMDDAYMRERAADVKDISERLVSILAGNRQQAMQTDQPIILAADDLAPSETVQLDKEKILAFVTMKGSTNSHTAILARMMNIPAIIGLGTQLLEAYDGKEAIVDGTTGTLYIEPDTQTLQKLQAKANEQLEKRHLLEKLCGKENISLDGKKIDIYANVGSVADVNEALKNDAGGIGLFRSEFLYLQSKNYPSENEQFTAYKMVAEMMAGKKVIIRTLDIGADKQIDYFNLPHEDNPAMGYRAIRICLDNPELFKTQLRALYRASAFGKISIMFPMITSLEEITEIKGIIDDVKQELNQGGIPYAAHTEIGIMIETPAAALISDLLAKEVDFFSIGTNDLTQYTLALDRQNPKLGRFYNPHHKGLLRLIRMVVENAHKEEKWVGICGELGADTELTETFVAMGVDELSVSPPFILPLRNQIRNSNIGENIDEVFAQFA